MSDPNAAAKAASTDTSQDWAGMDGATAFHLIERHAENWTHAGELMDAWRLANAAIAQPLSDEQIDSILNHYWGGNLLGVMKNTFRFFAREIERAHGIEGGM